MRGRGRRRGRGRGRGRWSTRGRGQGNSRVAAEPADRAFMCAKIGDKVEVRSDEEGFIGAWYAAEVVHTESSSACIVEYEQLLSDDGFPLQELVLLSNLRPRPPTLPARSSWLQGHFVEAYDRDGWWSGVVVHTLPDDLVLVRFRTTGEELPFRPSLLRGLQNWDNGAWTDLTQAGQPDEDHFMDATDTMNGSASPDYHAELLRKRGRPRKTKLPSMDIPSILPEETSQVMEPDPEEMDAPMSLADPPVEAIRSHKALFGCELPSMEELPTLTSVNDHVASALDAFARHSGITMSTTRLELVAYQLLVKALRLKGPLNWNQERLLADVRLHLNITNADQTFILRELIPSSDGTNNAYKQISDCI
ncbi:hypothetical protein GOP47_0027580 [Adiantum capillus-veneris]|nr:hypothetical protein GOP47_0027580 [Adiantum capillus-veneris]